MHITVPKLPVFLGPYVRYFLLRVNQLSASA